MPWVKKVRMTWRERYDLMLAHEWWWASDGSFAACPTCKRQHKWLPQKKHTGHTKECRYAEMLRKTLIMAKNEAYKESKKETQT